MQLADTQQALVTTRSGLDEENRARRTVRQRQRQRRRRLRTALLALFVIAGAAGITFVLLPKPVPVDAVRARRGALAVEVRETGRTRIKDTYVVSAPVSGSLVRLALEPNDSVTEGKTLAQIAQAPAPLLDPRSRAEADARLAAALSALKQAEVQVTLARTASDLARVELTRIAELARNGSAARSALDQAQFGARMRADEVSSAVFARKIAADQVRLARAAIAPRAGPSQPVDVLSPVSGNVLRVYQESAAVVSAGTPLLQVGDLEGLEVVVDLLTTDAVQVRPGTPVTIEGWGGERGIAGRVRKVELAAFTRASALGVDEQRTNVVVVFADPRERWVMLGDGYRVEVRLLLWEGRDVLKVPHGALFRRGDGWSAFRIDGGAARLVPVRIGHRGESEVEILSGLQSGETVIVDPGDRVEDGVRVQPR